MANLNNKLAVVTGSTRGFGFAIAQQLLRAGARVVVSGRSQATTDKAVQAMQGFGNSLGVACNVAIADEVYHLAREATGWGGRIDIWINNAGYSPTAGSVIDFPPEEILQTFQTNCMGVFNGTQTAMALMLPAKQGSIVNIYGRGSDLKSATPSGVYGATKAWITSFTRTLADEYKGTGVQVVGFSPGMMLTDMLDVEETVGERVTETMRSMPMVLASLASAPEVPAAELVKLLATNRKEFVEYRYMSGWRAARMISKLVWMQMNPKARPPAVVYRSVAAFRPPVTPHQP